MGSKGGRPKARAQGALWQVVDRAVQGGWGTTTRLGFLLIIVIAAGAGGGGAAVQGAMHIIGELGSVLGQGQ